MGLIVNGSRNGSSSAMYRVANANSPVIVVIVSFRRSEDILTCLTSLQRSTFEVFEVVVVENGGEEAFDRLSSALSRVFDAKASTTLTSPFVANPNEGQFRNRRVFLQGRQSVLLIDAGENLGYAGAVNLAVGCLGKERTWRGVWLLNPDTQPQESALEIVVSYAARGGFGLVGSRLVDNEKKTIQMRGGARWLRSIGRARVLGYGEPENLPADIPKIERRLQWISGAATYATREFIEAVGLMDESYFLYCEDVDWSFRRGPFRLGYAHDAVVLHVGGTTTGQVLGVPSNFSIYLMERNKLKLTRKHFPWIYPLTVFGSCATLAAYLLKGNYRGFVAGWRGWLAGLKGENGRPDHLL
jgi:N-acetylglucosaminyl-diphospho-decaprenol L-rhamnosyltransferase